MATGSSERRTLDHETHVPNGLRRFVSAARTEGAGTGHEIAAIAVGVFIGCTPFYGLHLLICWLVGSVLRLNRLKMYLASNISNPLVAPWLLLAEIQTGSWLRRGTFHALTTQTLVNADLGVFGGDLLAGSVVVGLALAGLTASGTYGVLRGSGRTDAFVELVRHASDRYVQTSITAWEFARGKLINDPVYYAAACSGVLRRGGTLLDVGCGQGLMLALLAEMQRAVRAGRWPASWPEPPLFERMIGIEIRPRVAAIARRALADDAEIIDGDACTTAAGQATTVLLFDVLHMMHPAQQEALLASLAGTLQRGGVILIREADAAAGWRFAAVRYGNRVKAVVFGAWRQELHFRAASDWLACFERLGLRGDVWPMGTGTPFANALFRVTAAEAGPAPSRRLSLPA